MAELYIQGKTNIGKGNIDLINDKIICILVDTDLYIPDLDNDSAQSDIPTNAIIAEKTIAGQNWSDSIFDADDVVFSALSSTQEIGAVVLAKYNENIGLSYLLYIEDSSPAFPVSPDGTDFTIEWSNGTNKIFKL